MTNLQKVREKLSKLKVSKEFTKRYIIKSGSELYFYGEGVFLGGNSCDVKMYSDDLIMESSQLIGIYERYDSDQLVYVFDPKRPGYDYFFVLRDNLTLEVS